MSEKSLGKKIHEDIMRRELISDLEPVFTEEPDMVNHPSHYISKNGIETIDVIEAFTDGLQGMEAVCTANALKYICRWKHKNGVEDLRKARWYLNHLIDILEKESDDND